MSLGVDVQADRKEAKTQATTLQEAFDRFKQSRTLRPKTISVYDSAMRRCFADWLDKPITDISKEMVEKRHKQISSANGPRGEGKSQANQAMRVLRTVINYAAITFEDADGKPLIIENPVKRLTQVRAWNKNVSRQDVIDDQDLKRWYDAVLKLQSETARDYLLPCLFTGLRRT